MKYSVGCALLLLLGGCGGSGGSSGSDGGPGDHIVGATPFTYSETAESTNGTTAGAVASGYTLDAGGAVFSGAFEASGGTTDCYQFLTGTATDIDVQVFLGGDALDGDPSLVFLSLDQILDDGYSALTGSGYFDSAAVQPSKSYRLCATPSGVAAAGESYTIELRQSP